MRLIRQFDGTACLAMVASNYKAKYSVTSIREIAGTDTHGTNLAGLVKAATVIGFSVQVLKGDKEALSQDLPLPFIVHIKNVKKKESFFILLLLKKLKKKKIKLEDFCKVWRDTM